MADYISDDSIPVFLINGFLEAGKTSFITYTIGEEYFHSDDNTLLIVCEEGECEYDASLLMREKTYLVVIDEQEKFTPEYLKQLEVRYKANRVIVELNGMWNPDELLFPNDWELYQQITIMDGTTLGSYLNNMRSLMGPMLRNTELCIVNRCDGIDDETLQEFKRKLRPMMLSGSMIEFEDKEGPIELDTTADDLPYDVSGDHVEIVPEDYGIWFLDAKDYPERYLGKTVTFTARIMKSDRFEKNMFVPGRMAMTCCENDMAFLGFLAISKSIDAFQNGDWVKLTASFGVQNRKEYGGEGPVLTVTNMVHTAEIEEPAGF